MEEKEISIKQNAFFAFIYQFSSILLIGVAITIGLGYIKCPNIIINLIDVGVYITAIVMSFIAIRKNCRSIILNNSAISVSLKKFGKVEVIQYIKTEDIISVEEDGDCFVFNMKDEKTEVIPLSYYLAPSNKLKFEVRKALFQTLGEKANSLMSEELQSYIDNGELPKNPKEEDNAEVVKRVLAAIGSLIVIFIGSLIFLYSALLVLLKGLTVIF